mgnify:CR=1 FL=1
MRVADDKIDFLKSRIHAIDPDAEIFLFGSRVDDTQKGGDIDLLILSDEYIPRKDLRGIKVEFYQQFGYQQVDMVNYLKDEENSFKSLVLLEAEKL